MSANKPILDPSCHLAPDALRSRRVCVNRTGRQKLVVPCDPPPDPNRWFLPLPTDKGGYRDGNEVAYYVDGTDTFEEMARVIKTASSPDHFIYLLGWWLDDGITSRWNLWTLPALLVGPMSVTIPAVMGSIRTTGHQFPLNAGGENLSMLLTAAALRGVQIRAMIWKQPFFLDMQPVVDRINDLPNDAGGAILDGRLLTQHLGSHHQKVLVVNGSEGPIAFTGGVDINIDRVEGPAPPASPGSPMHDVHVRIRGPAVNDLLTTFVERWTDHPYAAKIDQDKGPLIGATLVAAPVEDAGFRVQIAKTYPNTTRYPVGAKTNPAGAPTYRFAPMGLQTCKELALRAIATAKRFVYIEDQYFYSDEATDVIAAAIPRLEHVTILLTWASYLLPAMWRRRQACLARIRAAGGDKLRVCFLDPEHGKHTYVHSKTTIVDDEFAIVGTPNYCRRSFTHDSEVSAGIIDHPDPFDARFSFARRLRMRLWAEHLGVAHDPAAIAELTDGAAAGVHFVDPPAGAKIVCYDETRPIGTAESALLAAGDLIASDPRYVWFSMREPNLAAWLEGHADKAAALIELEAGIHWDVLIDPDGS